jgi:hypothetical protein
MDDDSTLPPWISIQVDGEPFEWRAIRTTVMESDGPAPRPGRRSPLRRSQHVLVMMRRPSNDRHSFGLVQESGLVPNEAQVCEMIRSYRNTTPLALDWRPHERAHARELAMYWSRLPATAREELAQAWLARCERRCGTAPRVNDSTDLSEVSAETLRAARHLGLGPGDEEASAQEDDVRVAFERYVEPW